MVARRSAALGIIVVVGLAIVAAAQRPGGPAASPSLPTAQAGTSSPGPASRIATAAPRLAPSEPEPLPTSDPQAVASCFPDDLALSAGGWGGATGSLAGGATLINVSSGQCRIGGTPRLELLADGGKVIAGGAPALDGPAIVLNPGATASVITVWQNWCADPPAGPLALRLLPIGVGRALESRILDWTGSGRGSVPRCDVEDAPSTITAALPFEAPDPPEPPQPGIDELPCETGDLSAFLGEWGAAAGTAYASVVVFNRTSVACLFDVAPRLELRDAGGAIVTHRELAVSGPAIVLPSGWAAQTFIGFSDWCLPPPRLPLALALRLGRHPLRIAPTSESSTFGAPACNSVPPAAAPLLFLDRPFALPGSEAAAGN